MVRERQDAASEGQRELVPHPRLTLRACALPSPRGREFIAANKLQTKERTNRGAFECVQRYFLLEAKWQAEPIGLKELDAFHAKVERKLSGTLGVFIPMSGYPRGASDSLLKAKSLKIVLFGADDMEARFDPAVGFKAVLSAKLRAASEYGLPYHEFRPLVVAPVEAPNSGRSTEGQ